MTEDQQTEQVADAAVRRVRRTKRIRVQHSSEIGALVRLARRASGHVPDGCGDLLRSRAPLSGGA